VAEPAAPDVLEELHVEANKVCFIARSVNFPVLHEPTAEVQGQADRTTAD
jgi:organic hydroperoxide reductase OsmC/OhrA